MRQVTAERHTLSTGCTWALIVRLVAVSDSRGVMTCMGGSTKIWMGMHICTMCAADSRWDNGGVNEGVEVHLTYNSRYSVHAGVFGPAACGMMFG
ncbi:hypothetical protein C8Q74DRAFT_1304068 [Fomes fomentarius]|nr:hypothetical protein C8Q74DRAFT_1304068 [Fomes fomentarius]